MERSTCVPRSFHFRSTLAQIPAMASIPVTTVVMAEAQFRLAVSMWVGRDVSRSALYRYRDELGLVKREMTMDFAQVMAYYVTLRSRRVPSARAKQLTIRFAEENDL